MDPYYLVIREKTAEQEEREPQVQKIFQGAILETVVKKDKSTADNCLKLDQHILHPGSISYADVAAGRTSPCSFDKNKELVSPEPIIQVHKSELKSSESSVKNIALEFHQREIVSYPLDIEQETVIATDHSNILEVPSVTSSVETIESPVETHVMTLRNYHPWRKTEHNIIESESLSHVMDKHLESDSFHCHQHRPVWAPGSLTYADILRGKHGSSCDLSDNQKLPIDTSEIIDKDVNQLREIPIRDYYEDRSLSNEISDSISSQSFLPSVVTILSTADSSESPIASETLEFQEQTQFKPELCVSVYETVHQQSSVSSDIVGMIPSPMTLTRPDLESYQPPVHQYTNEPPESFELKEASQSNNKSLSSHEMETAANVFSPELDTVQQSHKVWKNKYKIDNSIDPSTETSNSSLNDLSLSSQKLAQWPMKHCSISGEEESERGSSSTMPKAFLDMYDQFGTTKGHLSYAQILAHGLSNKPINNQPIANYENKKFERQTLTNQSELDFSNFSEPGVCDYLVSDMHRTSSNETSCDVPNYDELRKKIDSLNIKRQSDMITQHEQPTKHILNTARDVQKETECLISHSDLRNIQESHCSNRTKKVSSPKSTEIGKIDVKESNEIMSQELLLPAISSLETEGDDPNKSTSQLSYSDLAATHSSTRKKKSKKKKKKKTTFSEDVPDVSVEDDAEEENVMGRDTKCVIKEIHIEKTVPSCTFHERQMYDDTAHTQSDINIEALQIEEGTSLFSHYLEDLNDNVINYQPTTSGSKNSECNLALVRTGDNDHPVTAETFNTEYSTTHSAVSCISDVTEGNPSTDPEDYFLPSKEEMYLQSSISKPVHEFDLTKVSFQKSVSNSEVDYDEDQCKAVYDTEKFVPNISHIVSTIETRYAANILVDSPMMTEDKQEKRKRKKKSKKKTTNVEKDTEDPSVNIVSTKKHKEILSSVSDTDNIVLETEDSCQLHFNKKDQTLSSDRISHSKKKEIFSHDDPCTTQENIVTNITGRGHKKEEENENEKSEEQELPEYSENSRLALEGNESRNTERQDVKDEGNRHKTSRKKSKNKDAQLISNSLGSAPSTEIEESPCVLAPGTINPISDSTSEYCKEVTCVPVSIPQVLVEATDHNIGQSGFLADTNEQCVSEVAVLAKTETNITKPSIAPYSVTQSSSPHKDKNKSSSDEFLIDQSVTTVCPEPVISISIGTYSNEGDIENENTCSTTLQQYEQLYSRENLSGCYPETVHPAIQEKTEDKSSSAISDCVPLQCSESDSNDALRLENTEGGIQYTEKVLSDDEKLMENIVDITSQRIERKSDKKHIWKYEEVINSDPKQSMESDALHFSCCTPLFVGEISNEKVVSADNSLIQADLPVSCGQSSNLKWLSHSHTSEMEPKQVLEISSIAASSLQVPLPGKSGEYEDDSNNKDIHHEMYDTSIKYSNEFVCDEESKQMVKTSSPCYEMTYHDCMPSIHSEISNNALCVSERVTDESMFKEPEYDHFDKDETENVSNYSHEELLKPITSRSIPSPIRDEENENFEKQQLLYYSGNDHKEIPNIRNQIRDREDTDKENDARKMSEEAEKTVHHPINVVAPLRTLEGHQEICTRISDVSQSDNVPEVSVAITGGINIHPESSEDLVHKGQWSICSENLMSPSNEYNPSVTKICDSFGDSFPAISFTMNESYTTDTSKPQHSELTPELTYEYEENKMNIQWQEIAESLVSNIWPYYLYTDAEKSWYERCQKERHRTIDNLPYEQTGRSFAAPSQDVSIQGLEVGNASEALLNDNTKHSIEEVEDQARKPCEYTKSHSFEYTLEFPKYPISAIFEAERVWKELTVSKDADKQKDKEKESNTNESFDVDVQDQNMEPETEIFSCSLKDSQHTGDAYTRDISHTLTNNISRDSFPTLSINALLDAERSWKELISFNSVSQEANKQSYVKENEEVNESIDAAIRDQTVTQAKEPLHYSLQNPQSKSDNKDMKYCSLPWHILLDDSFSKYATKPLCDAECVWKELAAYNSSREADKPPCSKENEETNESNNIAAFDQIIGQEISLISSLKDTESKFEIEDVTCHTLASHLMLDDSFWTNKWYFDDAECKWQEHHASSFHSLKSEAVPTNPSKGICSGYDDQDGDDGDCNIPAAPGLVEWQTEDDGAHLIMKKTLFASDLEELQSSLEDCEKKLTSLSSDSLRNMYDDILKIRDALGAIDVKTEKLEETIQQLPTDQDVQSLNVAASNLRRRITTLLTYIDQGCSSIQKIQVQQEQQLQNIAHYEALLQEIGGWCTEATDTLGTILQSLPCKDLLEKRAVLEVISHELVQHDKKLNELMASSQVQNHSHCLQLGKSLYQQLASLRSLLDDVDVQLTSQLAVAEEPVKTEDTGTVDKRKVESSGHQKLPSPSDNESYNIRPNVLTVPSRSADAVDKKNVQIEDNVEALFLSPQKVISFHDERENTIDSNASPIADEEVSIQSMPEEDPVEQQLQENKVAFHVASQTGDSLKEPPPPMLPVPTRDVGVEFHQPVDTHVQTTDLTTTGAQTSVSSEKGKEKIKILKKFDDHEEIVEIATERSAENLKKVSVVDREDFSDKFDIGDDNVTVEVKFRGKKAKEKENLQSAVDSNEMSTEVIVEADGRKRIVLKTYSVGTELVVGDDKIDKNRDQSSSGNQKLQPSSTDTVPEDKFSTPEKKNTEDVDLQGNINDDIKYKSKVDETVLKDYVSEPTMPENVSISGDDRLSIKETCTDNLKMSDVAESESSPQEKDEKSLLVSNKFTTDTCIESSTFHNIPEKVTVGNAVKVTEDTLYKEAKTDSVDPFEVMKHTTLQSSEDQKHSEVDIVPCVDGQPSASAPSDTKQTDPDVEPAASDHIPEEVSASVNEEYLELASEREQIGMVDTDDMSVETSLAESTDVIVSTEVDKISSDTTKPTELEIVFLDTSSVQTPFELDSIHSLETGYEPEDISSEMSIPEKKKKKRKKRVKQTSDVELHAQRIHVHEEVPHPMEMGVAASNVVSVLNSDQEKEENTITVERLDSLNKHEDIACEENENAAGEVILSISEDDVRDLPVDKSSGISREVSDKSDNKVPAPEDSDTSLLPHLPYVSLCTMTDSSVQATVEVAVETVQTISPKPLTPPECLDKTCVTEVVPFSECDTQTSPVPETVDIAMQTLSPLLDEYKTCATQVSPTEHIDSLGVTQDTMLQDSEINHCATQVTAETQEGYMQTSPIEIEQVTSEVVDVSLQTVISACEIHDSFVQTSPELDAQVHENIDPTISADAQKEEIPPKREQETPGDNLKQDSPQRTEITTIIPTVETVHSSMQTTNISVSCESQTSPDNSLKDAIEIPTASVSMQTSSDMIASVDNFMQTSPVCSFESGTMNASIQTEISNTGNISTQADIELKSEGIAVDIQTNKEELIPSVETSMQTDTSQLPVTETINTLSQTIQSGPGMPVSDSCVQTIVGELISPVEDFTQTNIVQPIAVTDTSIQTNKLMVLSEQPSKQESIETPITSQSEKKKIDEEEEEKNESSSEEQLEVKIQALVVFPSEKVIKCSVQKSFPTQSSPLVQADSESNTSVQSDRPTKKKHKKKAKKYDKNTTDQKHEISEKSLVDDMKPFESSMALLASEREASTFSASEHSAGMPDTEEKSVAQTKAPDTVLESGVTSSEFVSEPHTLSPVHIVVSHETENTREHLEKEALQVTMLSEDSDQISGKIKVVSEAEPNLVYSEDSSLACGTYASEQMKNINLKIASESTSVVDGDTDESKREINFDLVSIIDSTKNENEENYLVHEIPPDSSRNMAVIPSRERKPSAEKIEFIASEECSRREVCHPRENDWKQVQCLVADRVQKLQKERHATHLSGVLYLATLQHIVTDESFEQKNNTLQHKINALNAAINSKDKVIIQKSVITIVQSMSTWLESIEYHVLLTCQLQTAPTADNIKELGILKQEIMTVGQKVEILDSVMELVYVMFDGDDVINMKQCISCLQKQVEIMTEVTNEREHQAARDLNRWEEFLNGVNNISVLIEELKEQVDQVVETDMLVHRKLEVLEQIESTNHSHQQKTTQLMSNAHSLLCDFPGHEVPPELYGAYETTRSIEHTVKLERDRQLQLIALADEYEQTLKEFAQIVDVADALVESSIVVSSLEHLQEEMQKHRKFFVNLSHCRCILESLEGNLDTETRNKHSELHQQLHTRASGILDKAAGRAQQMALAASRWTVLEQGMKEERNWLQVAHQRVPDLQTVTSSDYDQYISLYQSLSADVAVHHGHCAQLIEVARRLQELVLCPGLEARYDEHLEVIAKLQEDINKNLHCLLSFRETWQNYVIMTEKLCHWMKYAEKELAGISSDDQHPGTNMKHFWELKAQYEVHNNIRNEASSNFNAAMRIIPVADENLQCQLHAKLEERWWNVSSQIQSIQTAVLEILSNQEVPVTDKLAALQQELQELQSTLNDTHGVIKKEEELELYIQRLQVMLACVEHIEEELSRLGLLSIDETEKVGILLCGAGNIELQVKEELEGANVLREKINAIQKGLNRIRRSHDHASNVLDQCEVNVTQGQDVVEQALRNCQGVGEELTVLWQDVMDLRQLLHTLPMSLHLSISAVHLERNISQVQDHHTALETRSAHLLSLLKNRLAMWQHFEQQLELVQQSVQETDYMMELLTVQGSVDYDRLVKATECLEGLYGSLDQREDLLDELRVAAAPLAETCAPEVSAKIKVAVEDVEKSWNNTRQTLRELCERYQDAARLWRQYREASDCVKTWAEQQLDSTAHLSPAEALHHVKVCEETLEAHQARLGDLRGLVAQIAADVGLDAGGPLADDVAALGRRLEDVRESLAALAEVAEAQQIGQDELQSTCDFLASVKQSLSMVEEANEKDIENQLSALRNHLLALGKTEGQLQTFKERSVDLTSSKSETSVVEILQLWQQVFRETFQHYHRLSARLVKSQDSAAALRLWHEYLLHVQSFLSSSIPEDYRGLTEHQHLCEIHQNLLMSQQSVLLAQNEGRTHPDSGSVELSVIEQFNSLTNLHNETLARIMERHSEVGERLVSWEKYSQEQACLLAWLRDIERERSRLQLHNIHIRRIPKVLAHIQTMLEEKVPLGESQAQDLLELQNNLFHNTDETVAASVRLEYAAMSQRISNIKAALETWKDFLDRINSLAATYEKNATTVQTVFQEIHSAICESQVLISHADIRNRLDSLRNLRSRMLCLTSDLETMNVTLEQLRECLSPMDMKTLNQRTWLLWQSHNDLDHQLAVLCHQLEERINLYALFESRRSRFVVWVGDMEHRLDQICIGDPEEVLSRIQTEIQGDMALKSREVDWLLSTGHELIAATSGDDKNSTAEQNDLENKLSEVHRCWEDLQNLGATKVNKLQNILRNLSRLEQQLSELRTWCHQIETQLMKPLVISECSEEVFGKRLQEIEELQNTIEQQSGNIAEVLNVSELLLSDYELMKTTVNTESISIATEAIEKRWKHICEVSAERKCNFMITWKLLKNILALCEEKHAWIQTQEDTLREIQRNINFISQSELQEQLLQVENVLQEVESQNQRLVVLDHSYSQLVKSCRMVPDNFSPTTSLIHSTLQRWHALTPTATTLADLLCQDLKLYRDFVNTHGKAVTNLTELDIRLTQLQHLHAPNAASVSNVSQEMMQELEEELQSLNSLLLTADSLGATLLQKCKNEDRTSVQEMIDEYQLLRNDIKSRLASLRSEHLSEHDAQIRQIKERDESIQVETLRFEQDTAIQVNTLPHLKELTPKSLYGFEAAIRECKTNLSTLKEVLEESPTDGLKLATALAGAQSSIELVQHLSANLFEKCGVSEEQRRTSEVAALYSEYERLCSLACVQHQNVGETSESARLTCPLCSQFNWHQLDNDLWRLEQWLQFSESTQRNYQVPPTNIEQLEDTIQDHREFLMDLDGHKNIVMSLNIVGTHLADHADDEEKAEALRSRLEKTNMRWDAVCQAAAHWQSELQQALMENQGFHKVIEELVEWLEKTETTIRLAEPVDLAEETSVVEAKYNKFRELHDELERCEPRVMSLQDAADQLLHHSDAPENSVLTRLTSLRLRLQSLRRITGIYVLKLGAVLGHDPSELGLVATHGTGSGQNVLGASLVSLSQELLEQAAAASSIHTETRHSNDNDNTREDEVDTTVLTRGYQFFGRVLRASLPIQALMLLILGVASLVPSREEDYSCTLSNNLANSFEPLLFYPNGPPPV